MQDSSHAVPPGSCNVAPILVPLILSHAPHRLAIELYMANQMILLILTRHGWSVCDHGRSTINSHEYDSIIVFLRTFQPTPMVRLTCLVNENAQHVADSSLQQQLFNLEDSSLTPYRLHSEAIPWCAKVESFQPLRFLGPSGNTLKSSNKISHPFGRVSTCH